MVSETKGSRVKQREEDEKVGEKRVTGEAKKSVRKGGSDGDGRIISLLESGSARGLASSRLQDTQSSRQPAT